MIGSPEAGGNVRAAGSTSALCYLQNQNMIMSVTEGRGGRAIVCSAVFTVGSKVAKSVHFASACLEESVFGAFEISFQISICLLVPLLSAVAHVLLPGI